MTGYDIQKWQRCIEIAKENGVKITVKSESFHMFTVKDLSLGAFATVDEVFAFLCGYQHSKKGRGAKNVTC